VDLMLPADPKATGQKDEGFLIHLIPKSSCLRTSQTRAKSCTTSWMIWPYAGIADSTRGRRPTATTRQPDADARWGNTAHDAIYLAADELMKPKDGRKPWWLFQMERP